MARLYVTQQGAVVHKSGDRLVLRKDGEIIEEVPIVYVDEVLIFGNAHMTTPAMGFLMNKNIPVAFLSSRGKYRGRLQSEYAKDTVLRQRQYQIATDAVEGLQLAKHFVRGKLTNALHFCQRQPERDDEVDRSIQSIRQAINRLDSVESGETLLGYEGSAAAAYYKAFRKFMKTDWNFTHGEFRPPPDPVNAMLSLGYTLLFNNLYAFVNVVGFDPYCGFFHQPKPGHATLASDLMEEFRIVIVDRYVLSLINNNRIQPEDFQQTSKGIRFTKDALDRFLNGYHGRMLQPFQHPTRNEQTTYLRTVELQVRHLARVVRGTDPVYQPFLLRG